MEEALSESNEKNNVYTIARIGSAEKPFEEDLVIKFAQKYIPTKVEEVRKKISSHIEQLKKETKTNNNNTINDLEKYSLLEKIVVFRLSKWAKLLEKHKSTALQLVLKQQLDPYFSDQKDKDALKNPSVFVNKHSAIKDSTIIKLKISPITMSYSKDKILFLGYWNGTIDILNIRDESKPELLTSIKAHTDEVTSLILDSHNKILFSGSKDETIKAWNIRNPSKPNRVVTLGKSIGGHSDQIVFLTLSSDNKLLISGFDDGTIKIWNAIDPSIAVVLEILGKKVGGHTNTIISLILTSDNKTLISCSQDKTIKIWDISNPRQGVLRETLNDTLMIGSIHKSINSLILSTNNKILVSGYYDGTIKIWDAVNLSNPKHLATLDESVNGHTGRITSLSIIFNNKILISNSWDRSIRIWDIVKPSKPKLMRILDESVIGHVGAVSFFILNSDNKMLCSTSDETIVALNLSLLFAAQELEQLPQTSLGVLKYFFIKEMAAHYHNTKKTLVVTDSLLKELFEILSGGLQTEFIKNKYVQLS